MIYSLIVTQYGSFPDVIHKGVIYVKKDECQTSCCFKCPCGKHDIFIPDGLNNGEGGNQERQIIIHEDRTVTLKPSIKVNGWCNLHFFITKNQVTY